MSSVGENCQWMPIAVRAYTELPDPKTGKAREYTWSSTVVIFDTETTIDKFQSLTFGSYRYCRWDSSGSRLLTIEEGLIYADDLPKTNPKGFECLQKYAEANPADVHGNRARPLRLLSRDEFAERVIWGLGYNARSTIVAFNLPFDLSRIAIKATAARRVGRGGFSLKLFRRTDTKAKSGDENRFRPRVIVRHVDSKLAFIQFGKIESRDTYHRVPDAGMEPDPKFSFKGHFLDLRTLTHALTSRSHSVASACEAFEVEHSKLEVEEHGVISSEYIDYCRRDVLASMELLEKLRQELDSHPVSCDPCRVYSSATMAKLYFREMGLQSPREKFKSLDPETLGHTMSAFFGGRAEDRIRKAPVPVVYTDFLSMYPTVQVLMDTWSLVAAAAIERVDATDEVRRLLDEISLDDCFDPGRWPDFRALALVEPDRDVLPIRAKHNGTEWTVGVNYVTSDEPLYYALPDLIASKLATGRAPRVLEAFRLVPKGVQRGLRPVRLRGSVEIDPRSESPFKKAIQERSRIRNDETLDETERERTQHFAKIFSNSGAYGVFVQMDPVERRKDDRFTLNVFGRAGAREVKTNRAEKPSEFTFPPVAALITSAARLMLMMTERCVSDLGGTYAFVDTDSMAIVASKKGGPIPCENGTETRPDGRSAIRALSWSEVESIRARFEALNPYDRDLVPGSILQAEAVNFETPTKQREIMAYAISAKRYVLYTQDAQGNVRVLDGKEHGLGIFMNPIDPNDEANDWIQEVWQGIVTEALGGAPFAPEWGSNPAMMRSTVSTPHLSAHFDRFNRGKAYRNRIKPFNFLIAATVDGLNFPPEAKPTGFRLVAPFSTDPRAWLRSKWVDIHSGLDYRIRGQGRSGPGGIRVKSIREVLDAFRSHPESKSADSMGVSDARQGEGLLDRRLLRVLMIQEIGKESNRIEEQQEGVLIDDPQLAYSDCPSWFGLRVWLSGQKIADLSEESGFSERRLRRYRDGSRRPNNTALRTLLRIAMQGFESKRRGR